MDKAKNERIAKLDRRYNVLIKFCTLSGLILVPLFIFVVGLDPAEDLRKPSRDDYIFTAKVISVHRQKDFAQETSYREQEDIIYKIQTPAQIDCPEVRVYVPDLSPANEDLDYPSTFDAFIKKGSECSYGYLRAFMVSQSSSTVISSVMMIIVMSCLYIWLTLFSASLWFAKVRIFRKSKIGFTIEATLFIVSAVIVIIMRHLT